MEKRGQITVFIILGILLLFILIFIFFARDQVLKSFTKNTNVEQKLELESKLIQEEITKCSLQESNKALSLLLSQAGFLTPTHYVTFYGQKFVYLCTKTVEQEGCTQEIISKHALEERLTAYLQEHVPSCLDLSAFKSTDYHLTVGDFNVASTINQKNILLQFTYPITLSQGTFTVSKDQFTQTIDYPLGEVLDLSTDILNAEAQNKEFDVLAAKNYEITLRRPSPDTLYIIKPNGYDAKFQFAIQG